MLALLSSCRAMRLLNQIVAASSRHNLDVLHTVEHGNCAQGSTITPQLVGVYSGWDTMLPQQTAEEGCSRLCVAVTLKEDVQHHAVLQGGSPQPVVDASDIHMHVVEMPPRTPTGFPVAQALGEQVTEGDAPGADRFPGHADPTFQQQFFDIPVAQREPVIPPDGVADHVEGAPGATKLLTAQHRVTLPQQRATTPGGTPWYRSFWCRPRGRGARCTWWPTITSASTVTQP